MESNCRELDICSICMDEIVVGQPSISTICNHKFHSNCYTKCVSRGDTKCPNCRKSLIESEDVDTHNVGDQFDMDFARFLMNEITNERNEFNNLITTMIHMSIPENFEIENIVPIRNRRTIRSSRSTRNNQMTGGIAVTNIEIFETLYENKELESFGIDEGYSNYLRDKLFRNSSGSAKISLSLDHYILFTNHGMKGCSYIGRDTKNICFATPINTENTTVLDYRCKDCIKKIKRDIYKYVHITNDKLQLLPHK